MSAVHQSGDTTPFTTRRHFRSTPQISLCRPDGRFPPERLFWRLFSDDLRCKTYAAVLGARTRVPVLPHYTRGRWGGSEGGGGERAQGGKRPSFLFNPPGGPHGQTESGVGHSPSMLEPVRPEAMSPDRALCLPTLSHFVIVNKTSLSLCILNPEVLFL